MASTMLDEFFIKISADNSSLNAEVVATQDQLKNLAKFAQKGNDTLSKSGKKAADTFSAFKKEAMGALAVFTGGRAMMDFVKDTASANTQFGNLVNKLGMAPQKITQLRTALKAVGSDANAGDAFLQTLQADSAHSDKRSEKQKIADQIGISLWDSHNQLRHDIVQQIANSKAFQEKGRINPAVAQGFLKELGGDDGLYSLVTRKNFNDIWKKSANFGPTQEQIKQSQKLNEDWVMMQAQTSKIMQNVLSDFEPIIEFFVKNITQLEKFSPKSIEYFVNTITSISVAFGVIKTLRIAALLAEFTTGITGLSSAITTITGPLGALLALMGWGVSHNEHTSGISATGNPTISESDREKRQDIIDGFFQGQGFPKSGSKALAERAIAESGGDPNAVGDRGLAKGIFQWHPERLKNFKSIIGKDFKDSDLYDQLNFAAYELNHGEKKAGDELRSSGFSATGDQSQAKKGALDYTRPKAWLDAQKVIKMQHAQHTTQTQQITKNHNWYQPATITNNITSTVNAPTNADYNKIGQQTTQGIKTGLDRQRLMALNTGRSQ